MISGLRDSAKRLALRAGGLPAYHRVRNAQRLTVITFHRVLDSADPRRRDADPEWTVSVDELASCLAFVKDHYTVVSLDEVLDTRRRGKRLPSRPLLITFDDGWADNEEHALPVLEAARLPAVIFVSADAVGRHAPFWREALRSAWLGGRIDDAIFRALWSGATDGAPARLPARDAGGLAKLLDKLSELTRSRRDALLRTVESRIHDGLRHMLTAEQLRRMRDRGVAVGAHGRTHEPLSRCEDLEDELVHPRKHLRDITGEPVTTLALPHSLFTPDVLDRAARTGYELVFTGEPRLAPARPIPFAIGRIPITPGHVTDERGRFRAERLAIHLFRRQHVSAWT
jgi:peptidoglycan/xylan/chitin deacetylase (PgdA/CDA1 family)